MAIRSMQDAIDALSNTVDDLDNLLNAVEKEADATLAASEVQELYNSLSDELGCLQDCLDDARSNLG